MTQHLDPATLYALLDGELDAADEGRAESHLLRCARCRAVREECGATLASLRWYAAAPPSPPTGYWESFWDRFEARVAGGSGGEAEVLPFRKVWLAPALATAAAVALLIGSWWGADVEGPTMTATVRSTSVPSRAEFDQPGWESDVQFFERATVAVGGVDPMSKGLVLVALGEAP